MFGLMFAIPAMIMILIAIVFYAVFGLLLGSFAIIGTAGKVAPSRVGITIFGGAGVTFFAFLFLAQGGSSGGIENGIIFIISLFIGSLAMLVLAMLFSATAEENTTADDWKNQPIVENEIKKNINTGGWGLRKSGYSDNQHLNAQKNKKQSQNSLPPSSNNW